MLRAFTALLLVAVFSWELLNGSSSQETPSSHDGSTVTAMLARLGLGPLSLTAPSPSHSDAGGCDEGDEACGDGGGGREGLRGGGGGEVPEDMCWGYEKNCSKEKRLFVPKCEGAAKPW